MFKILRAPTQWVLFLATLGGGLLLARFVMGLAVSPRSPGDVGKPASVLATKIVPRDFQAPVVAYGTARAPRLHAVRSEVSGKVIWVSERLREGKEVEEGEDLLRIDSSDIELSISQVEAQIVEVEANLAKIHVDVQPFDAEVARLEQELENQRERLRLGADGLRIAQQEVDRLQRLVDKDAVPRSQLEAAQGRLNQLEQVQVEPKSRIDQIPLAIRAQQAQKAVVLSQEPVLRARTKIYQAQLGQLRLEFARTTIRSPAAGIVVRREQESGIVVKQLARGDVVQGGLDLAWIRPASEGIDIQVSIDVSEALYIGGVGSEDTADFDFEAAIGRIPDVRVQWYPHTVYSWTGRVERVLGQLDAATRNAILVVNVAEPGSAVVRGTKVPLTPGMYCRVEIPGAVHAGAIVIPRRALHEGEQVYLVRDGKLEVRRVVPLRYIGDHVVLESGLSAGDVLVTSELSQAIPGLRIQPVFE